MVCHATGRKDWKGDKEKERRLLNPRWYPAWTIWRRKKGRRRRGRGRRRTEWRLKLCKGRSYRLTHPSHDVWHSKSILGGNFAKRRADVLPLDDVRHSSFSAPWSYFSGSCCSTSPLPGVLLFVDAPVSCLPQSSVFAPSQYWFVKRMKKTVKTVT